MLDLKTFTKEDLDILKQAYEVLIKIKSKTIVEDLYFFIAQMDVDWAFNEASFLKEE